MGVEIRVPQMGESVTEGTIANWTKKVGERVEQDELLVEIETDKVTMEVNAPASGVLTEIIANKGDAVGIGALLGVLDEKAISGQTTSKVEKELPQAANTAKPETTQKLAVEQEVILSPAARKISEEKNIDSSTITGTGKDGRIMKEDILKSATSFITPQSHPSTSNTQRPEEQREERVKMTRLRQTIARRLKDAQNNAAMLTTFNEIDMTNVMALRSEWKDVFEKKHGTKLGFMSFFVKACVQALKELPAVNAEIDGTDIIYKNYYHIGVAVGTEQGLVVPVVRDCDQLSFSDIEKTIANYGKAARDSKLSISDMQGGTFTISNGGVYGSLMSTPIINPPQSAILGMHKIQERPMVVKGEIKVCPMMYLALSYDHRIIDGKEAVTFLVRVKEGLEDPRRLLLDL
jgi:2-oxoglutarate dehydrogenase E2 component (dihydrolipoamide succinyltransferase)